MLEEGRVREHFDEAADLSLGVNIMIPYLRELVDELVKIDVRKANFEILDILDDLAKDIVIVELCRIWYSTVLQRHAVGCSIESLHHSGGEYEKRVDFER